MRNTPASKVSKILVIALCAVVVVGGYVGWRVWSASSDRERERSALVERARALYHEGHRLSDAALEIRRAVALVPEDAEARMLAGEILLALSLLDEAHEHLSRAVAVAAGPSLARAQLLLGHVSFERYRGTQREEDFRAARNNYLAAQSDAATQPAAMDGFAALFLEKGPNCQVGKGLELLRELVAAHPDSPEAAKARELLDGLERGRGKE